MPATEATVLFENAVASPTVPGISVALAGTDGIIWAQGFGWADLENKVPITPETKMRIGSVAKPFTAAAMMRLVEQGKLNLDRSVRSYVPAWPSKHPAITLRQLASHTAGIRHYEAGEFLSNRHFPSVTASLDIFKDSPLLFIPGTDFSYSTYAWTLVSAAIEAVADGRSFGQIMDEEVFKPIGMMNSTLDNQHEIIPHRQRPYSVQDGELRNSTQTDHSYKWAGGGIIASTSDVVRFAMAHLDGEFLKQDTARQMFTAATIGDERRVEYGIGWRIGFEGLKQRFNDNPIALRMMDDHANSVMHTGGSIGGTTMMILCLDHQRAVAVVKNVDGDTSTNHILLALQTLDIFHTKAGL